MRCSIIAVGLLCIALASCAYPTRFARFTAETPPCHLAPLSEAEVHEIVVKAGKSYAPPGLPEPIWQVTEFGCVYRYEQSGLYFNGKPATLNMVDASYEILVARDRSTFEY